MYPNPVTGDVLNIILQNDETENVIFKITNLLGQVIKKGNLHDDTIDLYTLKSGIYLLEINDGEEKMVRRFIKE